MLPPPPACATEAITWRFLNPGGPFRRHLDAWAQAQTAGDAADAAMNVQVYNELTAYSTSLVVMQRLESRHAIIKRAVSFKVRQLPAHVSATLRRAQNADLRTQAFQSRLPEFLGAIGELYEGTWRSKTELLTRLSRETRDANHEPMLDERQQREVFVKRLAEANAAGALALPGEDPGPAPDALCREHLKATLKRGCVYALKGLGGQSSAWTVFRAVSYTHLRAHET